MKLLRYLPFAYFCGIHGFALFAPYAAMVFAMDVALKTRRTARLAAANTDLAVEADPLEISPV
jgi:hypothetical protein